MSHFKPLSLDQIHFEDVSLQLEGLDPVLQSVDLLLPMDQTILVQSTNPTHALYFLEVLAGHVLPQSGRIFWNERNILDKEDQDWNRHDYVGCYFDKQRPHATLLLKNIFQAFHPTADVYKEFVEYFDLQIYLEKSFKDLSYEVQKLSLLICSTLKNPQMLILEDPASGLSEKSFLQFLDWIQRGQRLGFLRHVYLTNHHPMALRHLDYASLYLEDGLIYLEEETTLKKAVHF